MRLNIKRHVILICRMKQYVFSLLAIGYYVKPIFVGKKMCNTVLEVFWARPRDKLIHVFITKMCLLWLTTN